MIACGEEISGQRFITTQTRIKEILAHMAQYGDARLKGRDPVVYIFLPAQVNLGQLIIRKTREEVIEWERTIPFNGSDFAVLLAQRAEGSPVI